MEYITKAYYTVVGKNQTVKEVLREYKRELSHAKRDVQFEIQKKNESEKENLKKIKKYVEQGKVDLAKRMSVTVSKNRSFTARCEKMMDQFDQLEGVLTEMSIQDTMSVSMAKTVSIMAKMNSRLNIGTITRMVQMMDKSMTSMGIKTEMIQDALEQVDQDGMDEQVQEDADQTFGKICAEIGIKLEEKLVIAPSEPPTKKEEPIDEDQDLIDRLDNLKKNGHDHNK